MIKEQRYTELDGLRGLAAFVVVVHHAFLVSPGLADSYQGQRAQLTGGWWLTHTPLHLVWDGPAAVIVFFVLSGFVLTLPFLREQHRPAHAVGVPVVEHRALGPRGPRGRRSVLPLG